MRRIFLLFLFDFKVVLIWFESRESFHLCKKKKKKKEGRLLSLNLRNFPVYHFWIIKIETSAVILSFSRWVGAQNRKVINRLSLFRESLSLPITMLMAEISFAWCLILLFFKRGNYGSCGSKAFSSLVCLVCLSHLCLNKI